jgi:hypothetical protein
MTLKALYPLTGTMMLMGITAMLYGVHELSPIIVLEGVVLLWLGFTITVNTWELNRVDM